MVDSKKIQTGTKENINAELNDRVVEASKPSQITHIMKMLENLED